jgi:hypothetical protein
MLTAIRDWPRLIEQAFTALRPGGWIQLASTVPEVKSDDDSLPPNSAYREIGKYFFEIGDKMGTPIDDPRRWSAQLSQAGFTNVKDVVLKIPSGPWAKNRHLRKIGELERVMVVDAMHACMLRGWAQVLKRREEELTVLLMLARKELSDPRTHAYVQFHITYGQKPPQ